MDIQDFLKKRNACKYFRLLNYWIKLKKCQFSLTFIPIINKTWELPTSLVNTEQHCREMAHDLANGSDDYINPSDPQWGHHPPFGKLIIFTLTRSTYSFFIWPNCDYLKIKQGFVSFNITPYNSKCKNNSNLTHVWN